MKEEFGDLWDYCTDKRNWIGITTNGCVKSNGCAVMGRGTAYQATLRYAQIAKQLGTHISTNGNILGNFPMYRLISIPVKHNWWEKADIKLIEKSLHDLYIYTKETLPKANIYLPRPGCGNGQLTWEDVKPLCEQELDDQFTIIQLD